MESKADLICLQEVNRYGAHSLKFQIIACALPRLLRFSTPIPHSSQFMFLTKGDMHAVQRTSSSRI